MSRRLDHPVTRRLRCRCHVADETLLWDWLVEQLDPARFLVRATALVDGGARRETELHFTSQLDARRFTRWAESRGFRIDALPLDGPR
jgi:hypothetical protein